MATERIKKILLIDDDQEMCEELSEILEDEGYHVCVAFNGLDCIRLIEKQEWDILLLDLKLPGLTGIEILKIIKERRMELKVLVLTGRPLSKNFLINGKSDKKDGQEDILKLADGVINKPYNIDVMLRQVKKLYLSEAKENGNEKL
ncbi:MAG: response regulator [bacterium]